jgi:phosphoribosyl-AMP cyclohydrolase
MTTSPPVAFAKRGSSAEIERGTAFAPKFDADGLIPAIATDAKTGTVLMFAWMNPEALSRTLQTREAHFWSRSRKSLWKKGEESGNVLSVQDARTDCDQDVILLSVTMQGTGVACHTGARSCFYRSIDLGAAAAGNAILRPV